MPCYRIHRLKESQRQSYRWAPHTSGVASVKPMDYRQEDAVEAPSLYAAWSALREAEAPLQVGDLLETESGELYICKYVGFEQAQWVLPEEKTATDTVPGAVSAGP